MIRIAFHDNSLCLRGTSVAVYDYADANESLLGNISFILSDRNQDLSALEKFEKRFPNRVFLYNKFLEVENFIQHNKIDVFYAIKHGNNDGKIVSSCRNFMHAIFRNYEPHGDYYVYVSSWLAKTMSGNEEAYLPHIVSLPKINDDFREKLHIPKNAIVFGRYGGLDQFNIPFVHEAIHEIVQNRTDIYFLFMNTYQFCSQHPQIIHLSGTWDLDYKAKFINTCDALIHARAMGETFGLTIAEFLYFDKAVVSWCGPKNGDLNHLVLLGEKGLWYRTKEELLMILNSFNSLHYESNYWSMLVSDYTPEKVIQRFNRILDYSIKTCSSQNNPKKLTLALVVISNKTHNLSALIQWARQSGLFDQIVVIADADANDPELNKVAQLADIYEILPVKGYIETVLNHACSLATTDWILRLDCDERLGSWAKTELPKCLSGECDYYWLPRYWLYQDVQHHVSNIYEYQLRLFRRGFVDHPNHVHFSPIGKGKQGQANFHIFHFDLLWTIEEERREKMQRYQSVATHLDVSDQFILYTPIKPALEKCQEPLDWESSTINF